MTPHAPAITLAAAALLATGVAVNIGARPQAAVPADLDEMRQLAEAYYTDLDSAALPADALPPDAGQRSADLLARLSLPLQARHRAELDRIRAQAPVLRTKTGGPTFTKAWSTVTIEDSVVSAYARGTRVDVRARELATLLTAGDPVMDVTQTPRELTFTRVDGRWVLVHEGAVSGDPRILNSTVDEWRTAHAPGT